jgi:CheY-like chemotaxis protein
MFCVVTIDPVGGEWRFHEECYNTWASFEPETSMQAAPLAGVSILVVGDDRDNREMLETYLTYVGATVRIAATACAGLEQLKAVPPSIVLVDIGMPDLDGLWLLREIRSLASGSDVPVVAVTGRALRDEHRD